MVIHHTHRTREQELQKVETPIVIPQVKEPQRRQKKKVFEEKPIEEKIEEPIEENIGGEE